MIVKPEDRADAVLRLLAKAGGGRSRARLQIGRRDLTADAPITQGISKTNAASSTADIMWRIPDACLPAYCRFAARRLARSAGHGAELPQPDRAVHRAVRRRRAGRRLCARAGQVPV